MTLRGEGVGYNAEHGAQGGPKFVCAYCNQVIEAGRSTCENCGAPVDNSEKRVS